MVPVITRPMMMFSTFWSDFNELYYYAKGESYHDIVHYDQM